MQWWKRHKSRELTPGQTLVYLKPGFDFSFSAVGFALVMVLMGIAAVNTQTNLFFGVFGLMAGVLSISAVMSFVSLHGIRIERQTPEFLWVGAEEVMLYRLSNQKRFWPLLAASIGELDGCQAFAAQPYSFLPHTAAGGASEARCRVLPRRRGIYTLDRFQFSSSFPFGFVTRAATAQQPETIVIFPALAKVNPHLLHLCQSAENTGAPMRPRHGGEDEFYGARQYRPGENPRWINWKRTARTGELVVKEMTRVAPPRLVLLVDTCSDSDSADALARVEQAIAMAASLASDALEKGYPVGLCAWNNGWLQMLPARGKRQRLEVLTALARLPRNTRNAADALLAAASPLLTPGSTRVLLSAAPHDQAHHGGGLTLAAGSAFADAMFTFAPTVQFAFCSPAGAEAARIGPISPEAHTRQT